MALSRSQVRLCRSLHQVRGRKEERLFLVEGPNLVKEALREGWPLKEVFLTRGFDGGGDEEKEFRELLELARVQYSFCSESEMLRMADAKMPQGVVALAELPQSFEPKDAGSPSEIILMCECISDPGNLGTLLRTADWFGCGEVHLGPGSADPFAPKVVRSSAGSIFRVNVIPAPDFIENIELEKSVGRSLFAATASGNIIPDDLPRHGLRGLVIGHETRGITREIAEMCSDTVRVPGSGRTESLNLAVAAGILLYALGQCISC